MSLEREVGGETVRMTTLHHQTRPIGERGDTAGPERAEVQRTARSRHGEVERIDLLDERRRVAAQRCPQGEQPAAGQRARP